MTTPRRVVFLTHSAAESGAEQALLQLLATWPPQDGTPVLVVGEQGPVVERARRLGLRTLVTPMSPGARNYRRAERNPVRILRVVKDLVALSSPVARILREHDAEIVVAVSVKSLVYGLLAGRRARTKVVWSLHDRVSSDYFPRYAVPVLRHVVPRLVDGIIVNSRATGATVRPGRTPVLVSHPAIVLDPREFAPPHDPVRSVVMVGRLAPWKAQDNFLRAFAEVFGDGDVRATVVGGALFGETDYERFLVRLAQELGIAGQVDFTGHVADVWAHLVHADVLVHCSRIPEPFGQVVVQGMWARCAVIASSPGGPAEIVANGDTGLLTPCDDIGALTEALRELRDDPDLRRRLAERGRSAARQYDAALAAPQMRQWLDLLAG